MPASLKLALVLQGSLHQYWKFVQAGAKKAAAELSAGGTSVNLICRAPMREDDREEQAHILERLLKEGVDAVVLAPFDNRYLVEAVERAARAGIATAVIDSPLDSSLIVSFVATDNKKGGALAADRVGSLLDRGGKVLLLRYQKGVGSTEAREEGFAQRIRAYPGVELLLSEQYAGVTRDAAKVAAEELLRKHADVNAVFTPNESSTAGMLMALQSVQQAGKVIFVGFDASEMYVDTMRYHRIHGLVVQNPFLMGELGVRTLAHHLAGKPVQKRVDIAPVMVTPDNIDKPDVQELLHLPPAA
jgi:ribose transport system substrate-binding protein